MNSDKIIIELTPFEAMQIVRWQEFIKEASEDPLSLVPKWDANGINNSIQSIKQQVCRKITMEQINDAFAQREVNKLTGN